MWKYEYKYASHSNEPGYWGCPRIADIMSGIWPGRNTEIML